MTLRIGILTCPNAPLVGHVLQELVARDIVPVAMIVDARGLGARDLAIHSERTDNKLPPIPLEIFAGLPIARHEVRDHNDTATVDLVRALGIDLLLNSETTRILKGPVLETPAHGIFNVHPGLLPEFRGCTCVEWAIHLDEPVGNTVHVMTSGIDEGPIVLREAIAFDRADKYTDVRCKVFRAGARLLARAACDVAHGRIARDTPRAQTGGRYFKPIDPESMQAVHAKLSEGRYRFQRERPIEAAP
jgi:methionyl-tRNA formyltransferase